MSTDALSSGRPALDPEVVPVPAPTPAPVLDDLQVVLRRGLAGAPVPEWRALQVGAGAPPFCGPDWVLAVAAHLGTGEPLLVTVRRQGRLLALGAFAVHPGLRAPGRRGGRPLITFYGSGVSDYATVLCDPTCPVPATRLVAAVLDAVVAEVPGAILDLERVVEGEPLHEALDVWARARGYGLRRLRQSSVHALALPATVAEHDRALGRHARHEERRQWRRLLRRGQVEAADDLLADVAPGDLDALRALVAELGAVDAAHPRAAEREQPWRGTSGRTLFQLLATTPRPVLQLAGLRVDGDLIAYTFCLAGPRALHGYVQSYRRDWADVGPGALLLLRLRRRALEAGYDELDLLRGEEEYKRRGARRTRTTVRVILRPDAPPMTALVDRVVLLRRTYRDEIRRSRRLDGAVSGLGRGVDRARRETAASLGRLNRLRPGR
ncbi:GNAT family N-acetyltransferase [Kineococcus gynurae]|uniref:GNAT family N-acetyltransferase n=1 Tax=Kineococcus gynurae TaxID=452979 RepID=A0ABV5LNJ7_9ACTN